MGEGLKRARAAARATRRPVVAVPHDDWRDIKSAPNGEWILLYDEEWEATLGSRHVGMIWDGEAQVEGVPDFKPTHWQPLPEPPRG